MEVSVVAEICVVRGNKCNNMHHGSEQGSEGVLILHSNLL